jgi:hypothetical protein
MGLDLEDVEAVHPANKFAQDSLSSAAVTYKQ